MPARKTTKNKNTVYTSDSLPRCLDLLPLLLHAIGVDNWHGD